MTEKRFSIGMLKTFVNDNEKNYCYSLELPTEANHLCNLLNKLSDENKELKETNQLLKARLYVGVENGICNVCKHQYLVPHDMRGIYIAKCKKGHDDCSKDCVHSCEDFYLKDMRNNEKSQ